MILLSSERICNRDGARVRRLRQLSGPKVRRKDNMHASEVQKEIISLMGEIDDTGPLPAKEGRILVLLNALGAEISYDEKRRNGFQKQGIAKFWMRHAIRQLPGCIALMG